MGNSNKQLAVASTNSRAQGHKISANSPLSFYQTIGLIGSGGMDLSHVLQ